MAAKILVVVEDLFFLAKIQQAARLAGIPAEPCTPANLREEAECQKPSTVFVDLNHRSGAAVDAIQALKQHSSTRGTPVVGFLSHVQRDLAQSARAAGCDVVLPRSTFSQQLAALLRKFARPTGDPLA